MDEKIILAIDFNVESDKADKIWVEVYNHDPRAVAELLVLVDRLIERDHADESLVKDERFADAILALEPRYDGDILLNSPFVIAEKDKFIDENERWLSYDTLDVDSDILWENRFDVYNSGGYEVVTIRIFLQGKILADGISFYNGYYEDCPESYYHDDSISEYFYSAFEWEGQTPSVDDITVYGREEEKPEVSEKARQWEERWHKRSELSQRSSLDKRARNFDTAQDYVDYLTGTYIPDLIESGKEGTAGDFKEIIKLIRKGKDKLDHSDGLFLHYIETIMIPAMKESENEFTAEDYQEGLDWIQEPNIEKTRQWEERWHKKSELNKVGLNVGDRIPVNPGEYNTVVIANDGRILDYGRTYKIERPETGIIYDRLQVGGGAAAVDWVYIVKLYELYLMVDVESAPVSPETIRWEERWHKKAEARNFDGYSIDEFTWKNDPNSDSPHGVFRIEFPDPRGESWRYVNFNINTDDVKKDPQHGTLKVGYDIFMPQEMRHEIDDFVEEQWLGRNKAIEWQERWFKRSSLVKKALDYKEFEIERIPYGTDEDMFLVYNAMKSGIGVQLTVELLDNDMQTTVQNYWQKVVYDWENIGSLPEYQEGLRVYEEKLSMLKNMPASDKARQWEERWHKRSSVKTADEQYPKSFDGMIEWIEREIGMGISEEIYDFQRTSFAIDYADQEVPCFGQYLEEARNKLLTWYHDLLSTLGAEGQDIMYAVSEGWGYNGQMNLPDVVRSIETFMGVEIEYNYDTNTYTCVRKEDTKDISEKTKQWEERWHKRSGLGKNALFEEIEWLFINESYDIPHYLRGISLEKAVDHMIDLSRAIPYEQVLKLEQLKPEQKFIARFQGGKIIESLTERERVRKWEERWRKRSKSLQRSELVQA